MTKKILKKLRGIDMVLCRLTNTCYMYGSICESLPDVEKYNTLHISDNKKRIFYRVCDNFKLLSAQ